MALLLCLSSLVALSEQPLVVRATLASPRCFLGQAVGLRVVALAGTSRPIVQPPTGKAFRLIAVGTSFNAVATSGIGDVVTETNRYSFNYLVIPTSVGEITVPAFELLADGQSAASSPLRLQVRELPTVGRTKAFLGGVGPLRAVAEADPVSLRVGQAIEFRLRLEGPGARGSTTQPTIEVIEKLGNIRVEALPAEVVDEPPLRVFRWRLWPTRAATYSLPPLSVATFDPTIEQYVTTTTKSIPIRVAEKPALDPDDLHYEPPTDTTARQSGLLGAAVALAITVVSIPAVLWAMGLAASWRRDPRRLAARLDRMLNQHSRPDELARIITDGLAAHLHLVRDRPPGVLTPDEARQCFTAWSSDAALGERAALLVRDCDMWRFAGRVGSANQVEDACAGLRAAARDFLHELGRTAPPAIAGQATSASQQREGTLPSL